LHMAQLMPLPLTVSCFSKIQIGFSFLVPAHPGSPGQRAVKRVCVCVCVRVRVRVRARARACARATRARAHACVCACVCVRFYSAKTPHVSDRLLCSECHSK